MAFTPLEMRIATGLTALAMTVVLKKDVIAKPVLTLAVAIRSLWIFTDCHVGLKPSSQ
jgi:hypothetical protein